jgi:hypothetical protein
MGGDSVGSVKHALAVALGLAGLAACSSPATPVGLNGSCLLTTDCQPGLVCIPQKDGPNICTNNLATTVSTEDAGAPAPMDAAPGDAKAPVDGAPALDSAGSTDAGVPPGDATEAEDSAIMPVPEAGMPEAGMPEAEASEASGGGTLDAPPD